MESPDPVIFHARLDEFKVRRTKDGVTEHSVKLTAFFDKTDLPHLATLQEQLMQVAFAPAPPVSTFTGFEPS